MNPNKEPLFHCFVITLEHSSERRKIISSRLDELKIPFEFYPGVDGRKIDLLSHQGYSNIFLCNVFINCFVGEDAAELTIAEIPPEEHSSFPLGITLVREEIDFSSIHPGVELERYVEFVQPTRDDLATLRGVLQRNDEAVEERFFVRIHFLKWK